MRIRSFSAALLSLSLLTCGDPSLEEACDKLANALCQKWDSCSNAFLKVTYGDMATCVDRVKLSCEPALDAPGTAVTTSQISDCASALAARSCEETFGPAPPDSCRPRAGSLADGVACADDAQCQSTYCKKQGKTCGVCAKRVAAGEACTTDDDCEWELACGGQVCVKYVNVGESCDKDHPCRPPAECNSGGTCAKPGGAGESCDPKDQDCDLYQGLYCDASKTCKQLGISDKGGSCGLVDGTFTACSRSGKCKGGTLIVKGTCMAAAPDGGNCDLVAGPNCLPPARCVDKVCKIDNPAACK
jgi:hypothetical protein